MWFRGVNINIFIGYVRIFGCRVLVVEVADTRVSFFHFDAGSFYVIFFRWT